MPVPERTAPEKETDEQFLEKLLGSSPTPEEGQTQNPTGGRTEKSRLSEPTSKPKEPTAQGISDPPGRSRPLRPAGAERHQGGAARESGLQGAGQAHQGAETHGPAQV